MAIICCPECGKEVSDQAQACIYCGFPLQKKSRKKINLKKWILIGGAVFLLAALVFTLLFSGWHEVGGKWIYRTWPGVQVRENWLSENGNYYYLDSEGFAVTGLATIQEITRYFDDRGVMQTGLQNVDGVLYYFDELGVPITGWQNIDGKEYHFTEKGAAVGWLQEDGASYYFDASGVLQTGWVDVGSDRYFFDEEGVMLTDLETIDGKRYLFRENGKLIRNGKAIELDSCKYYTNQDGIVVRYEQRTGSWTFEEPTSRFEYYMENGQKTSAAVHSLRRTVEDCSRFTVTMDIFGRTDSMRWDVYVRNASGSWFKAGEVKAEVYTTDVRNSYYRYLQGSVDLDFTEFPVDVDAIALCSMEQQNKWDEYYFWVTDQWSIVNE